jgi:hypothetical protein
MSGIDIPSEEKPFVKWSRAGEVGRILCKKNSGVKNLPVKKTGEEYALWKKLICKKKQICKKIYFGIERALCKKTHL